MTRMTTRAIVYCRLNIFIYLFKYVLGQDNGHLLFSVSLRVNSAFTETRVKPVVYPSTVDVNLGLGWK